MSDDLITPENVSKELLYSVLDAAMMDVSYDKDGDIRVKEGVICFVLPNEENKDRIKFLTIFGLKPGVSELERLRAVNQMNDGYIMVRACTPKEDVLVFDYFLTLGGGVTKKAFVMALKRFCGIPHACIRDYGSNIVS